MSGGRLGKGGVRFWCFFWNVLDVFYSSVKLGGLFILVVTAFLWSVVWECVLESWRC